MLCEVESGSEIRFSTGLGELDRVLGGGGVRGSLVLVGGAPGIGKSTLLLQICAYLGKTQRILYVSGEESEQQIKMRGHALPVAGQFGSVCALGQAAQQGLEQLLVLAGFQLPLGLQRIA